MKKAAVIILALGYSQISWTQPVTADYVKFDSSKAAPSALAGFGFVYSDGVGGLFHRTIQEIQRVVMTSRMLTVSGATNEISVNGSGSASQDLSQDRTWSLSIPSTFSLAGKTALIIPNNSNPTTNQFGEVEGDNNAWGASRGAIQFYDGTDPTYHLQSRA